MAAYDLPLSNYCDEQTHRGRRVRADAKVVIFDLNQILFLNVLSLMIEPERFA